MTDNEIIKALECCVKDKCSDCPAKAMFCDANVPMAFALDLINRQSKEIGRLEKSNRNWRRKVQRLRAECDEIAEDYNNLIIENDELFDEAEKLIKIAKDQAIREYDEAFWIHADIRLEQIGLPFVPEDYERMEV